MEINRAIILFHVVTHLLQTGVLFIVLVTAIVVVTELSNLVMPDAVVPAVRLLLAAEIAAEVLQAQAAVVVPARLV